MSEQLRPYYYISGSKVFNSGFPTTTSAIYSGYSDWVVATQFKNTTNKPIKVDFVELSIGMYSSASTGVLVYADLSSINQSSIKTSIVSQPFTIPVRGTLNPIKYYLNKPLIIPAGKIFAFGFKVVTSDSSNYLSIAKTFADRSNTNNAKCIYDGENITTNINTSDIVPIESLNGVWSYRVPYINIYYSYYEEIPNVSKTNISLIQGLSDSITITNINNWTYSLDTNNYVSVSKSGESKLVIKALYNGVTETTTKLTITSNTQGKTIVTIKCNPPTISSINLSKTVVKPTQSMNIEVNYTDGSVGKVSYIKNNSITVIDGQINEGIRLMDNVLLVDSITSNLSPIISDWRNNINGNVVFTSIRVQHPKNLSIINDRSISSITIRHWSVSDISVLFSNDSIFTGKSVTYSSYSSVTGGNTLVVPSDSPLSINTDELRVECISETTETSAKIDIHIVNDYIVHTEKTLLIKTSIELTMKYPISSTDYSGCISYLPLFLTKYGNGYKCNPYNFPLFMTIPNDLEGNGDIYISTTFRGKTYSNISLLSKIKSPELSGGNTEVVCLNLENEFLTISSDTTYTLMLEFRYRTNDNINKTKSYTLHLMPFMDWHIDTFLYNTYNAAPIQGKQISYNPFGTIINSLYYSTSDTIAPAKLIMMNYGLFGPNCVITNALPAIQVVNTYYIVADDDMQLVYYNQNLLRNQVTPILENDYIGSQRSREVFEYFANCFNNFVSTINRFSNRTLHGSPSQIVSGQYYMWDDSVTTLANGKNNKFKYHIGDINENGIIDSQDANLALQFATKIAIPTESQLTAGDVDCDGEITLIDANLIQQAASSNSTRATMASPWKYIFNIIYELQEFVVSNVRYKISPDTDLNVKYNKSNATYDVKYRG